MGEGGRGGVGEGEWEGGRGGVGEGGKRADRDGRKGRGRSEKEEGWCVERLLSL